MFKFDFTSWVETDGMVESTPDIYKSLFLSLFTDSLTYLQLHETKYPATETPTSFLTLCLCIKSSVFEKLIEET